MQMLQTGRRFTYSLEAETAKATAPLCAVEAQCLEGGGWPCGWLRVRGGEWQWITQFFPFFFNLFSIFPIMKDKYYTTPIFNTFSNYCIFVK